MERIKTSNTNYYSAAEVIITQREPFNKNTLWIHPHDGIIDVKVFDKGWKVIVSSKDTGLSDKALELVQELLAALRKEFIELIRKNLGRLTNNSLVILKNNKDTKELVMNLELKLDRLTKKVSTLKVKNG